MPSISFATVVAALLMVVAVDASPFRYTATSGNLTVAGVDFQTPEEVFKAGSKPTFSSYGKDPTLPILAGGVTWRLYEIGVSPNPQVATGFESYFHCDKHTGCNTSDPDALQLSNPGHVPSAYNLSFVMTPLPAARKTGQFELSIVGESQHRYPLDFEVSVFFNYSSSA